MNLEPLSYFFGAWLGDGYSSYTEAKKYIVGVKCSDKEIITRCYFSLLYNEDPHKRGRVTEVKPNGGGVLLQYRVNFSGKDFCLWVRNLTGFKEQLPSYIWTASIEARLAMLAGLLDTDGSISDEGEGRYRLRFTGTLEFVEQVPELFARVGIDPGKLSTEYNRDNGWLDRYYFYPSIKDAAKIGFYFRCRRKQYRFKEYMRSVGIRPYNGPADYISEMETGGDPSKY